MQKLKGKLNKIILVVTAILLVVGVVFGVTLFNNAEQVSEEPPFKVELLGITEKALSSNEAENGENIEEGNEKAVKDVTQIGGREPEKTTVNINGMDFASKNHILRFELEGTDNNMIRNSTLTIDDIVVKLNDNTKIKATKRFESGPTDINDGKNGKSYVLALEDLEGDGQLTISIPEKKLTDEAGNKNISCNYTLNIYIDNTAPTIISPDEFNGGNIEFTAKDILSNIGVRNKYPSGTSGYQITDNNIPPIDGWTDIEVPEAKRVNDTMEITSEITLTNTNLSAGTHYIWVTDAVGNKASKQINVNYSVTLNNQGATTAGTTSVSASATTLPNIAVPTKTGYAFGGYYTGTNGSGTQYYNENGVPVRANDLTQDSTLYAYWIANNYVVRFNKNAKNVQGTMEDQSFSYTEQKRLSANKFVRIGYVFNGWNTQANGTGANYTDEQLVKDLTTTQNGVRNLYAQWITADATFREGTAFNTVIKRLAGNDTANAESDDNMITEIKYATIGNEPDQITLERLYHIRETAVKASESVTSANTYVDISHSSSNTPIYVWCDFGIVYWFSEDNSPKLYSNCMNMFRGLKKLTEIEQLKVLGEGETRFANFEASNVSNPLRMFYECEKLTSLDLRGISINSATSLNETFRDCKALEELNISNWNTGNITDMGSTFLGCESLTNLDVSGFDTSKVTKMSEMFFDCKNLKTINVSGFSTSNVTTMSSMFQQCDELRELDLSHFDTRKVENMQGMFYNCDELKELDLRNFNTSKVKNMYFMFSSCTSLERIYTTDSFVTTQLSNTPFDSAKTSETPSSHLFNGCTNLVGGSGTAHSTSHLNSDYARIDGVNGLPGYFTNHFFVEFDPNTTRSSGTMETQGIPFEYGTALSLNAYTKTNSGFREWNTKPDGTGTSFTNGQVLNYTLDQIKAIAQDTTDDRKVKITLYAQWNENARAVFKTGKEVNLAIKRLVKSSEQSYESLNTNIKHITRSPTLKSENETQIQTSTSSTQIYIWADGSTSTIYWYSADEDPEMNPDSSYMFYGLRALQDMDGLNTIDTGNVTTMESMFEKSDTIASLDLSYFSTKNVVDMQKMFQDAKGITSLTFGNGFDTANVTNMSNMFYGCTSLASINFGNSFNTRSVQNFSNMFRNTALTSLDLSNFDTSSVTSMNRMFAESGSLTNITFGENFSASSVTDFYGMFGACSGLTVLDLLNFSTSSATDMGVMFSGCSNLRTIYASDGFVTDSVTSSSNMFSGCSAIVGGSGTAYSANATNKVGAVIDGKGGPGYFTNHFYVEFNKNDSSATGTMANQAIPFNYDTAIKANSFSKSGYTLLNWNTMADGSGRTFSNSETINYDLAGIKEIAQDTSNDKAVKLTLYAQWYKNNYQNTTTKKYYDNLTGALSEASNGETIKVMNNTTEPSNLEPIIDAGKSVVLDLNGKTITLTRKLVNNGTLDIKTSVGGGVLRNDTSGYVTVRNNEDGVLNLMSGSIISGKNIAVVNYGNLAVTGNTQISSDNNTYSAFENNGTATINGGTFTCNGTYSIRNSTNASCAMSGGSANGLYNTGTFELTGTAEIIATNQVAIMNLNLLTISGGAVSSTEGNGVYQYGNSAMLNVTGGTISGNIGIVAYEKSTINISGNATIVTGNEYEGIRGEYSNISITGGKVEGKTDGIMVSASGSNVGIVNLLGGTISGEENGVRVLYNAILTMGENNGNAPSKETPAVISNASSGAFYGVNLSDNATFNFYGGKITGQEGKSINRDASNILVSYHVNKTTTSGKETAVLDKEMGVTADANGGTISATTGWTGTGASATKQCAENTTYGTLPMVTRTGYTLKGWHGDGWFDQDSILMAIDGTTKTNEGYYKVIPRNAYNLYGNENGVGTLSFEEGKKYVVEMEGYTESGNTKLSIGAVYTDGSRSPTISIAGNEKVVSASTDSNKSVKTLYLTYSATNNSEFAYVKNIKVYEAGTEYVPYYVAPTTNITKIEDHTITALWSANKYTIHFNANGGKGTMADQVFAYDEIKNLSANAYTRAGYRFAGWNTSENGSGTSYTDAQSLRNITDVDGQTINLYAQWAQNNYLNTTTGIYYDTLATALADIPTFEEGDSIQTIQAVKSRKETDEPVLASGTKAILDLNGMTVTLSQALKNNGTLEIISSQENGAMLRVTDKTINNNGDGTLTISSGIINNTNGYAIYNNSTGTVNVTGGSVSGDYAIYDRFSGRINITGGTISGDLYGIYMSGYGVLRIGTNDEIVSKDSPVIGTTAETGDYYGVYVEDDVDFSFYDGIIAGREGKSINTQTMNKPTDFQVTTKMVNGYERAYLVKPIIVMVGLINGESFASADGWTITGNYAVKTLMVNEEYGTLPTLNSRVGYKGYSWKVQGEGPDITESTTITTARDHSLIPVWEPKTSTIVFNSDGGTGGQSDAVIATFGEEMPEISTTPPTKEGYTFDGWYDQYLSLKYYNADGTSARIFTEDASFVILRAKWIEN
ncbi:MAG: BspA family leucine-rich repeat surface protein [Clostridia bacterium]|nr:BspA family leucine-rich repeat surface protein [Clostridia bacterium]